MTWGVDRDDPEPGGGQRRDKVTELTAMTAPAVQEIDDRTGGTPDLCDERRFCIPVQRDGDEVAGAAGTARDRSACCTVHQTRSAQRAPNRGARRSSVRKAVRVARCRNAKGERTIVLFSINDSVIENSD